MFRDALVVFRVKVDLALKTTDFSPEDDKDLVETSAKVGTFKLVYREPPGSIIPEQAENHSLHYNY